MEVINKDYPIHVLITAPTHFLEPIREQIQKDYKVTYAYKVSYENIMEMIGTIDAWIVDPGANYKIDKAMLSNAKKLRILVSPSTGSDHLDLDFCQKQSIVFDCLKGKEGIIEQIHASAEFSFALMLAMVRKLVPAANSAKLGFWREKEDSLRGIEIHGKTIGIIGFGRIGRKMARYSLAFGANVMVYDPYVKVDNKAITQSSTLDEVLIASDIICIHVHLDQTTEKLIGDREFNLMKPSSYFLNTSRGRIIDEDALMRALDKRKIVAAIDVISDEQSGNIVNHKLVDYAKHNDNLLLTPHIAGATVDSQSKATQFAIDRINTFFTSLSPGMP